MFSSCRTTAITNKVGWIEKIVSVISVVKTITIVVAVLGIQTGHWWMVTEIFLLLIIIIIIIIFTLCWQEMGTVIR